MPIALGIDGWAFEALVDRKNAKDVIGKAATVGIPGKRWNYEHLVFDPKGQRKDAAVVGEVARDHGFESVSVCGFVPCYKKDAEKPSFSLSDDPGERRRALNTGYRFIENAGAVMPPDEMGRLGGPFYRMHSDLCPLEDVHYHRLVRFVAKLAERAREEGVQLDLEFLNRFELSGPNNTKQAIALVKDVEAAMKGGTDGHPVKIQFDMFHSFLAGEDVLGALAYAASEGYLGSVHLGDTTRLALGTGGLRDKFGRVMKTVYDATKNGPTVPLDPELFCEGFRNNVAIWWWPTEEPIPDPYDQAVSSYEFLGRRIRGYKSRGIDLLE